MIIELNSRVQNEKMDDSTKDVVMSLYLSAVVAAGYQLMPEDAQDFGERVGRMVTVGLGIAPDAELAPEIDVSDDDDREETEDDFQEEAEDKDAELKDEM